MHAFYTNFNVSQFELETTMEVHALEPNARSPVDTQAVERAIHPDISRCQVPEHVAIIMDGNRRWARQRNLSDLVGHCQGAATLMEITETALLLGIRTLTVYAFSTENWARSSSEVQGIFNLIGHHLSQKSAKLQREGVSVKVIGDRSRLPISLREQLDKTIDFTARGTRLDLVLAINYGGRDDICRALRKVVSDCQSGKISPSAVDETLIGSYLDTRNWSDPELCIRTSGERRISNFLLWQLSYTEMVFTDTLWPDFARIDFINAIEEYQARHRRLGAH